MKWKLGDSMNNNIDIKTLEAFQDGNHKAFETIFIAYYNKTNHWRIYKIRTWCGRADRGLICQSLDQSSLHWYLQIIKFLYARNAAINFLKHKYVCDAYLNNNQETGYSSTSEEDLIAKELEMLIDELVGGMPEQRRMIYTLSRNEGLSNAEIAERLNTTKRNVESQLSLALKEIRKVISCFLVSLL